MWKQYGFIPEFYNIPKADVHPTREGYPLRPGMFDPISSIDITVVPGFYTT